MEKDIARIIFFTKLVRQQMFVSLMSKFAIYKSRGHSFKTIARFDMAIVIVLIVITAIMTMVINSIDAEDKYLIMSRAFMVTYFATILFWLLYSKYIKKRMVELGTISLTRQGIEKRIGGFGSSFPITEIASISTRRIFQSISSPGSKGAASFYLVSITRKDSTTERFVIGGQSMDKPHVDFRETVKKLEAITNHKLNIAEESFIPLRFKTGNK